MFSRRRFLATASASTFVPALAPLAASTPVSGAIPGATSLLGSDPATRLRLDHHRFGLNYTPSHNWWFCWNDWNPDPIREDLDRIAELGADHLRILLVWPFFQPNLTWVSPAHLERLDQLLTLMNERGLDALVTVFTGQLSGLYFLPPFNKPDPALYNDPALGAAQALFLHELARIMKPHRNLIGFDFGNEMNTCWSAPTAMGDAWMARTLQRMHAELPGLVHVNGVDHMPWFEPATFSPQTLASAHFPVMHAYPYWSHAVDFGGPMDPPSTHLLAALAALIRSYAGNAAKPVWAGEFNTCIESLSSIEQARWLEQAVTSGIEAGVSWFTYWDSHDVSRTFTFNSLEYSLGLLTNDGKVKEQGRVFRALAEAYRGKPVRFPTATPPPPPEHNFKATWAWLLDQLHWKAKG